MKVEKLSGYVQVGLRLLDETVFFTCREGKRRS